MSSTMKPFSQKSFAQLTGRLLAGAAVLAIALSAGAAEAQETLRLPIATDFDSFDPDNAFEMDGLAAINNVYEGLVEYVPGSAEIRGLLAKDWTISDDGLTYTFNLVEGATFHDGTPFNAAAVKTSFERRRDSELILSYFLWNVKDIAAPDDKTVVITLGMPRPSLLDSLAEPVGPQGHQPEGARRQWRRQGGRRLARHQCRRHRAVQAHQLRARPGLRRSSAMTAITARHRSSRPSSCRWFPISASRC